jgi:dihydropteroate synthase
MFTLNCKGRLLVAEHPLVMGIINLTPDSFYAGSRLEDTDSVLRHVESMLTHGADIIDIGAQSTRPHADLLSPDEELMRVAGIIDVLTDNFPEAIFSIDTFYSRVAGVCIAAGASIINDVSGGEMDKEMIPVAGASGVPYICMHIRGTPQTMHQYTDYDNLIKSIIDYFILKTEQCRTAGINDLIIDPGFGFSKNIPQNFELLRHLRALKMFDKPILAGLSRKSTIYKTLGITAAEALNGTTVMNTIALMNGADILRVHDVKEAKECVKLFSHFEQVRND